MEPSPTSTEEPSPTPVPPTATPVPPPAATTAPPAEPAADSAAALRQALQEANKALGDYRWTLNPDSRMNTFGRSSGEVDCQVIVSLHDRILSLIPVEVPGEPEPVRNARALALQGVSMFDGAASTWTNSCREVLASGGTVLIINWAGYRDLSSNLETVDVPWNQAIQMLEP